MRSRRLFFGTFGSLIPPVVEKAEGVPTTGRLAATDRFIEKAKGLSLEENLQGKLQRSSFAREHRIKVVEDAALWFKGVARRTGNALGSHRVGASTECTGAATRA